MGFGGMGTFLYSCRMTLTVDPVHIVFNAHLIDPEGPSPPLSV